jgi:hypothetical protein
LLADLADEQTRHAIESRALLQYLARHFCRTFMTVLATEIDAQFELNNHTAAAFNMAYFDRPFANISAPNFGHGFDAHRPLQ